MLHASRLCPDVGEHIRMDVHRIAGKKRADLRLLVPVLWY